MRIANSQVDMRSNRSYSQMGNKSKNTNLNSKSFAGVASKSFGITTNYDTSSNYNKNGSLAGDKRVSNMDVANGTSIGNNRFSNDVAGSLLQQLMNSGAFDIPGFTNASAGGYGFMSGPSSQGSLFAAGGYTEQLVTYQESESMSFSAQGKAVTEDGREIDFGISVSMSRSFMQYMNVRIPAVQNALLDPLVINIGTDTAKVSDQKFKFDLDADGNEDSISMPTKGSAFLALDKNGDGIINDGNELFGTQSGDGFGDLRAYDSDGNGWIDENDDIFDKLKVWYKDEYGKDVLLNLKEADVGAIFLGEQESEFTLGNSTGGTMGVIRSSGVFLRESGGAGTIQHVDLAVGDDEGSITDDENDEDALMSNDVGALTLNLDISSNSTSRASQERAKKRSEMEAKRADKAAKKKLMDERSEKRRKERKELQEEFFEKNLERHRMYKEAMGL